MIPYLGELTPLIVDALLDGASASKREIVAATLGHVVESTGYVVAPYTHYQPLLGLLLRLLNGELAWSTRREVLKVLGIMGALDPHERKCNQLTLQGPHREGGRLIVVESGPHTRSMEDLLVEIWPSGGLFTTSEEYYPTVNSNSLCTIYCASKGAELFDVNIICSLVSNILSDENNMSYCCQGQLM